MSAVPTTQTNLAEMRAPQQQQNLPAVHAGFFDLQGFELLQRVSKAFAASTLVPTQFQGNVPNCMIALNLANRMRADELMVMQNLYIVHGRPGWSSKFLIATFNQCGRFATIRYEFFGEEGKDTWGARAFTTELATGEKIVGPKVTIKMAMDEGWYAKNGSKWKTIPELMLRYRSGAWLVNTTAPEISMGLPTSEELHDVVNFDASGAAYVTTEELRQGMKDVDADGVISEKNHNTTESASTSESATKTGTAAGAATETKSQPAGGVSFALVSDSLHKAADLEVLDVAADLIGDVEGADLQDELRGIYQTCKEKLENPPAANTKRTPRNVGSVE